MHASWRPLLHCVRRCWSPGFALKMEGSALFIKFLGSRLILVLHYLSVSLPSVTRAGCSDLDCLCHSWNRAIPFKFGCDAVLLSSQPTYFIIVHGAGWCVWLSVCLSRHLRLGWLIPQWYTLSESRQVPQHVSDWLHCTVRLCSSPGVCS